MQGDRPFYLRTNKHINKGQKKRWTLGTKGRCSGGGGGCDVILEEANNFGLAPGRKCSVLEIREKQDSHFGPQHLPE